LLISKTLKGSLGSSKDIRLASFFIDLC